MSAANEYVDRIIRRFLSEHPEHIAGVRYDPVHGPLLDTMAVRAFAEWSKANGGDPNKCKGFIKFLDNRKGG